MWLACANAVVATFLVTGAVGLYEPTYQISLWLAEGNTEQDAEDELMGGAVEMQLDPVEEEVVEPETPEVVQPVVMEEPVPEPIEVVTPENAIFPVPEKEPLVKPLEMVDVKPKPQPKPKPAAPRPAPAVRSTTTTATPGGGSGAAQGLRTGGAGSRGKFPAPPYPAFARSKGIQGGVTLAISVDATGTVTGARVLVTSGSSELDNYACGWVQRRWRWPAGSPNTYRQPVVFRLR